jgi:hypothetical protein
MSSFRASARAVAPDGREWAIYAYRARVARESGRLRGLRRVFSRRAGEWTIEALSFAPYPMRYKWTTSPESKGQVLASVEGQLARGETPMPRNAKQIF